MISHSCERTASWQCVSSPPTMSSRRWIDPSGVEPVGGTSKPTGSADEEGCSVLESSSARWNKLTPRGSPAQTISHAPLVGLPSVPSPHVNIGGGGEGGGGEGGGGEGGGGEGGGGEVGGEGGSRGG
eukprot:scaffold29262_cov42-Phaeocystis_antarctica.AAC.1